MFTEETVSILRTFAEICVGVRLFILPYNPPQPKVSLLLQTEKMPRTAEGHITEFSFDGRVYLF